MKNINQLRIFALVILFAFSSCTANRFKGSASDRSGTNGATNGTGKIAR